MLVKHKKHIFVGWLLISAVGLAGASSMAGIKQNPVNPASERWMVEVRELKDSSYRDSLKAFTAEHDLAGFLYPATSNLADISSLIKELKITSKSPLLAGLDMRKFTDENSVKLGLPTSWQALSIAGDSLLTAAEAQVHGQMLLDAGIDFVLTDPFAISWQYGFGLDSLAAARQYTTYFGGLSQAGIDIVIDATGTPEFRNGVVSEWINTLKINGICLPLSGEGKKQAKETRAQSESVRRLLDPAVITLLEHDNGPLLAADAKAPLSDITVISWATASASIAEINQLATGRRHAKRLERPAQWKMERMVKSQIAASYKVSASDDRARQFQLALKSAVLLSNQDSLIPFKNIDGVSMAMSSFGVPYDHFSRVLHKYGPVSDFDYSGNLSEVIKQGHRISRFQVYIVAIDMDWFGQLNPGDQATFVEFLQGIQDQKTNVVAVLIGPSAFISQFAGLHSVSYHPLEGQVTEQLAPQLLFGAYAYTGQWAGDEKFSSTATQPLARLQYGQPWMRGFEENSLRAIDDIVKQAITDRAMPGCQVLVAQKGMVIFEQSYGYLSYDSLMEVTNETLYDLASVTKVSATLQMLMKLHEEGKIDLNATLGTYLPEARGTNKENLIVKDVLMHKAGLQIHIPFWEQAYSNKRKRTYDPIYISTNEIDGFSVEVLPGMYSTTSMRDSIWHWTLRSRLMKLEPGQTTFGYRYSDLGFIVIQRLVETVAGEPLNELVAKNFYRPLGLDRLCFQPLCQFEYRYIAPTELDYYFRKDMIWGTVHDQNASLMGGVAGHAGLFGSANSLAVLLQMQLQKGFYGGTRYFQASTVDMFTRRISPTEPRAYGWDLKDITFERKNTSFWSSETTYGHTGFTGTAVWVDPVHELVYIFLSNRIHPDAKNYKLSQTNIRNRIQDVIYHSFGG